MKSLHFDSTTSCAGFVLSRSSTFHQQRVLRSNLQGIEAGIVSRDIFLGGAPRVTMVQPTNTRDSYNSVMRRFPALHRPRLGSVFPQSIVRPIRMIIADALTSQPSQVAFVENDYVIQQFSAAAPTQRSAIPFCQGL